MTERQRKEIQEKLSVLLHRPLHRMGRYEDMTWLSFGEPVEEKNDLMKEKKGVGRFELQIESDARMRCGNEILMGRGDMFEPSKKLAGQDDYDSATFEWSIRGNNYYDEFAEEKLGENPDGFTVKKATISLLGDLKIEFENGYLLETFTGTSGNEEGWRFFDRCAKEEDDLVVCGLGLVEYGEDEDEGEDSEDEKSE